MQDILITTFVAIIKKAQEALTKYRESRYEWVGWRNDTLGMAGKPVEMVFEFDSVRNFSAMILHTNNMFSKDVQAVSDCYTPRCMQ
ncbi:Discoidin domain-containing receptor 2 [Pseudolycoriella hygida]|uniref:Discoidin domain-containing receptor 2 n=1 Tax=Pseudolycoriella hygida TaxID=35572 RepID=A0A9Q0NB20_9DIPT|nr:Discoidin domain-containing receptor 2 [Pseudolycoriella hygida]